MRELERGARKLLMRIERGRVGVVGHAQRLGLRSLEGAKAQAARRMAAKKSGRMGGAMSPETRGCVHSPLPRPYGLYTVSPNQGGSPIRDVEHRAGIFRHRDRHRCRQDGRRRLARGAARRQLLEAGPGREPSGDRFRDRAAGCPRSPPDRILPEAYVLPEPIAPHEAARRAGIAIDMAEARAARHATGRWWSRAPAGCMVPLTDTAFVIDLADELELPVILVARSTLGTINHTLLSIEAIRRRGLPLAGVVVNGPETPHNRAAIERYGQVEVIAEIPWLDQVTPATLRAIEPELDLAKLARPPHERRSEIASRARLDRASRCWRATSAMSGIPSPSTGPRASRSSLARRQGRPRCSTPTAARSSTSSHPGGPARTGIRIRSSMPRSPSRRAASSM